MLVTRRRAAPAQDDNGGMMTFFIYAVDKLGTLVSTHHFKRKCATLADAMREADSLLADFAGIAVVEADKQPLTNDRINVVRVRMDGMWYTRDEYNATVDSRGYGIT